MIFKKAFKYLLTPPKTEESLFNQFAGAKRWIFNRALAQRKEGWEKEKKSITLFSQNDELVLLKKQENLAWLAKIHSQVLQQALNDVDRAFLNFFNGLRNKTNVGYPRFNRYKARKKLNLLHCHLKNLRLDFFYKLALEIVKNHDIIGVEKMNVKGMLQGLRTLARAISDAGWGMFLNCLKNKAEEYGKTLYEVSSLLGSTRLCSNCGRKQTLGLGQREYICECGQSIDRDLNAAINIKNLAVGASV